MGASVFDYQQEERRHNQDVTSVLVGVGQDHSAQVGGRLQRFADNWASLIVDSWVIQTVTFGYQIEFTGNPPIRPVRVTPLPRKGPQREALLKEVLKLSDKKAIVPIFPPFQPGFWSTFFLAPKKSGDWRPILNLKPLNQFIRPKRFRMETLSTVLRSPIVGCWATSLDLKDAYLHVPIYPSDQRWLRFMLQGQAYTFRCLPFGMSTAPRVFTRVVKAVGAVLREQGVQIFMYLDDWLILSKSRQSILQDTQLVIQTVSQLGFVINRDKSSLVLSQSPVFLGAQLDLVQGLVFPSLERVDNILECVTLLFQSQSTKAVVWLKVLGLMASLVVLVPYCRLRMRPIQLHLLFHFNLKYQSMNTLVPMSHIVQEELGWWMIRSNLTVGVKFPSPPHQIVLTTDASKLGWGGHLDLLTVSGLWSVQESQAHINLQELWAVFLSLKAFSREVSHKKVLVKSDNSTVVAYINKQGGTKSQTLCLHTRQMLLWCIDHEIQLSAVHIPGLTNTLADRLSRGCPSDRRSGLQVPWSSRSQVSQGVSNHRSFCFQNKPSASGLLFMEPGRAGFGVRRSFHPMDRNGSLCFPSNLPHSKGSAEIVQGGLSGSSSGTLVATSVLVSGSGGSPGRCTDRSSPISRSSEDAGVQGQISRSPVPPSDCLDVIKQRYQKEGFSEGVAEDEDNPRRRYTLRVSEPTSHGVVVNKLIRSTLL